MEWHRDEYRRHMSASCEAERRGLYREAVEEALKSWDYIDGMMQYERKYESKGFASVQAIDMILKYAPLLLDCSCLDKLESLLKDCRRIEKNTSQSLGDRLADARRLLRDAHRFWDHLEWHAEERQDDLRRILGGDQDQWRSMAESWEKMGILHRTPEGGSYRLKLRTRMGEVRSAKCPSCGEVAEAPKAMFLEELTCPDCGVKGLFVILTTASPEAEEK